MKDNFPNKKLTVLTSTELPKQTIDKGLGSSAFVRVVPGIIIASYVVKELLK